MITNRPQSTTFGHLTEGHFQPHGLEREAADGGECAPPTVERRRDTRRRILKAAEIRFDGHVISCVVRNISESGAALDVDSALGLPSVFVLTIKADAIERKCRLVWYKQTRIGVVFE